jgi:hypothetical protein
MVRHVAAGEPRHRGHETDDRVHAHRAGVRGQRTVVTRWLVPGQVTQPSAY